MSVANRWSKYLRRNYGIENADKAVAWVHHLTGQDLQNHQQIVLIVYVRAKKNWMTFSRVISIASNAMASQT